MKELVNDLSELRLNQSSQINLNANSSSSNIDKNNNLNTLNSPTKVKYNNFIESGTSLNIEPSHNADYYSDENDYDKINNASHISNHISPVKVKLPDINPGYIRKQNSSISTNNKPKSAEYAVSRKMKTEALKYALDKSLLKLQKKQIPPNPPPSEN
jgi:hypothetical protein